MTPKLCPFCGKTPNVREAINHRGVWGVFCANFGDGKSPPEESGCAVRPHTAWMLPFDGQDGKTRAIEVWNRRASAPQEQL